MAEKETIEAGLKVVSNRCRNLRKAVDRAKTWQQAAENGQQLNPEQLESVKSLAKKELLLAEVQEIFKKQTTIFETQEPVEHKPQVSKRAAKAAKAKERRGKSTSASENSGASPSSSAQREDGSDIIPDKLKQSSNDETLHDHPPESASTSELLLTDLKRLTNENEVLRRDTADIKNSTAAENVRIKRESVRKVLNLFHVVDFLRQQGSREALLTCSTNVVGKQSFLASEMDMDLLCYFNVMLTTPNGNVPHDEAVDVSTLHCLEFLQKSNLDAFKDTSYSTLNQIVDSISSCPILTERGMDERSKTMTVGGKFAHIDTNGNGPTHEAHDSVPNVSVP